MSTAPYLKTIEDMEKLYYSAAGQLFLNNEDLLAPMNLAKTDAPVVTTTTGVYQAVFGAKAWFQLNNEVNAWGMLPKFVHRHSGHRVITARADTLGSIGRAEAAALPDSVKPTYATFTAKPKTVAQVFEVSEVQEYLAGVEDDATGTLADLRAHFASEVAEHINAMLLGDAGTTAGNNMESMDRVVSANSEVALVDANDLDIFGLDRDAAAAWHDAYVNHNSGTDRVLTDTLVRTLIQNTINNGANPAGQSFLTGHDTAAAIDGLYSTQVRYALGQMRVSASVNGVKARGEGDNAGMSVSSLYGRPIIVSKSVVQDTISRLYLLDTSDPEGGGLPRLGVSVAKPMQYFESGINSGTPFGVSKFADKGLYRFMGELFCRHFKAQGKIRDLK